MAGPAAAGPRGLRHFFVSILSDDGTSIEKISHLMGHSGTSVTEGAYRHDVAVLSEHVEPFDKAPVRGSLRGRRLPRLAYQEPRESTKT